MDVFNGIENVYFVGVGGIGMSALARYFKLYGFDVAGYDAVPSDLTKQLREEEIEVNYIDTEGAIGEKYRNNKNTIVVYTPAIPSSNNQLRYFYQGDFQMYKRSEILGLLTEQGKALCVAGTHGKTTTSTLLAFLLKNSPRGCSAFLGGISVNFGTNFLIDRNSPYIVVEADEYDRSFLHLQPTMAGITAMDEDHLDIYGNKANLIEAFEQFAEKLRFGGRLYLKKGLKLKRSKVSGYYTEGEKAEYYSDNIRIDGIFTVFDYHGPEVSIKNLRLAVPGRMNVENATLAITMALEAGVMPSDVKEALPNFTGVLRRFNIHAEGRTIYIDDYAHHPREIEAVLSAIREMWPERKLTVAFQPHLYSRTNDLHEWFARSLDIADEVLLLPIYPARELPIPGVTSEIILKNLKKTACIVEKGDILKMVDSNVDGGVFVTMGAGDIDRLIPELKTLFKNKNI